MDAMRRLLPGVAPFLLLLGIAAAQAGPQPTPGPAVQVTNGFGIDLYHALRQLPQAANLLCSPWSSAIALAMVAEGARGETAAEMARVLHLPPGGLVPVHLDLAAHVERLQRPAGSDPEVQQRIARLRAQLREAERSPETASDAAIRALDAELRSVLGSIGRCMVHTANAVWVDRNLTLAPDYVVTLGLLYGAGCVGQFDLRNDAEGARRMVNRWFARQTAQHVQELFPPGSMPSTPAVLLGSALYFRGDWFEPFRLKRPQDFTNADGTVVRVPMLEGRPPGVRYAAFAGDGSFFATPVEVPATGEQPPTYPDDGGFTMVEVPYTGEEFAMVVLAPRSPGGLPRIEQALTPASLARWLSHLQRRAVNVTLLPLQLEQNI
ncbi:MAG: serpin family protein, partial [Planctomycetes bacterium]|nr:serpin family protein [Planctomycetota bacterium]